MKSIIKDFISTLYFQLDEKLDYMWPCGKTGRINESNISLGIAGIAQQWDLFVYGECNIKNTERTDVLLIDSKNQWVCQVEVKFQEPSRESFDYDFWRVSEHKYLHTFLENKSSANKPFKDFKKYGLFIAGGNYSLYQLWNSPEVWLKGWFDVQNKRAQSIVQYGTFPEKLNDKKFGLVYYLIEVTEDNTEEWLNRF